MYKKKQLEHHKFIIDLCVSCPPKMDHSLFTLLMVLKSCTIYKASWYLNISLFYLTIHNVFTNILSVVDQISLHHQPSVRGSKLLTPHRSGCDYETNIYPGSPKPNKVAGLLGNSPCNGEEGSYQWAKFGSNRLLGYICIYINYIYNVYKYFLINYEHISHI